MIEINPVPGSNFPVSGPNGIPTRILKNIKITEERYFNTSS